MSEPTSEAPRGPRLGNASSLGNIPSGGPATALVMAESFDPYHRWLGIRDQQRPVNHYRLLGLEPLETDPDVIREGAARQLTYLKAHQNSRHRELCLKLIEEVTEAKLTLLDPVAKARYDQQLQARPRVPAGPAATAAPVRGGGAPCPQCNADNPPERGFCSGCGAALWEPCLNCGATAGTWEKFCGACGVQLAAMLQDRVAELAQREQQIQRWLRQDRLLDALPALEDLAAQVHPRLRPLADRAGRALEHLRSKLAALEAARNESLDQARQAAATGDDDRVVELLEAIPASVVTAPVRELLAQARQRREEVAALTAEIRAATKAGKTDGLLPKVERLLELRPDLESAARLREKLSALEQRSAQRQALERAQAAKNLAAAHDYAAAVAELEAIPESARTPAVAGLLEECRARRDECAWLLDYLEQRLLLRESDGPLAERLLKLLPHDARAQRAAASVRQQLAERPSPAARPLSVWTAAPGVSQRLGLPLGPVRGFRRIVGEPLAAPEVRAHLGCFGVALGLALQGLGQAAIRVNLAPREKPKRLALFSRPAAPPPPEAAWGLDLGAAALKAVLLTYDESTGRVIVAACEHLEHARVLAPEDPDRQRILAASLAAFLERTGVDPRRGWFAVNLPGQDVLYRMVRLPPVEKSKLTELVRFEAARQIPFPLEHVIWDYQLAPGREQEDGSLSDHEALLLAVKAALVTRQIAPLAEVGIVPSLVQSNNVALHNLMAFEHFAPVPGANRQRPGALVTLDVGAESTDLVVSHARGFWPRSIPVGGNHFTRCLLRELQLTQEQAERLKRQPHRAPRVSQLYRLWQPILDSLSTEVQRSLGYFTSQNRCVPLEQVVCLGGGMSLLGLLEHLRRR